MSKKGFSNYALSKEVRRALTGLGYEHPTEVQGEVIPVALQKEGSCCKVANRKWKTASVRYTTL